MSACDLYADAVVMCGYISLKGARFQDYKNREKEKAFYPKPFMTSSNFTAQVVYTKDSSTSRRFCYLTISHWIAIFTISIF